MRIFRYGPLLNKYPFLVISVISVRRSCGKGSRLTVVLRSRKTTDYRVSQRTALVWLPNRTRQLRPGGHRPALLHLCG
jgi:hypothetical protein